MAVLGLDGGASQAVRLHNHTGRTCSIGFTLLLLAACANTVPPPASTSALPSETTQRLAYGLIERVERESSCRFRITQVEQGAAQTPFAVLRLAYRGPEVECRQGLERLNRAGAHHGLAFVAARVSLAASGEGARHALQARDALGKFVIADVEGREQAHHVVAGRHGQ